MNVEGVYPAGGGVRGRDLPRSIRYIDAFHAPLSYTQMLHEPAVLRPVLLEWLYPYVPYFRRSPVGLEGEVVLYLVGEGDLVLHRAVALLILISTIIVAGSGSLDVVHHHAEQVGPNGLQAAHALLDGPFL